MTSNKSTTVPSQHRSVRSFVRRTGRMTPGQERAISELWNHYGIDYTPALLDFATIFNRVASCVLEIGFGNGESLVSQAVANREQDYLGIEVHKPGIGHCMMHVDDAGLSNLRVICQDALDVLQHQVPDGSLNRINLYFPDPWPKKRHHKRRIVQPAFMQLASSKLAAGGTLHIATDWSHYARHIDAVSGQCDFFRIDQRREHAGDNALDRPTTRFERRGIGKGHTIFDWRLQKI